MIVERVVLLGVEHLEQRRRGIAAEVGRHLVDLVEQEDRVVRARPSSAIWMILPGSAPMYVRRWPRISASSRTPPSDRRTNLRPVARAMLLARLVLPTPGGPTKHRIGPLSLLRQRLHREVLEDALLDLLQAVVVLVEDLLGLVDVEALLGLVVPGQARIQSM